jgi:hypothetical protein
MSSLRARRRGLAYPSDPLDRPFLRLSFRGLGPPGGERGFWASLSPAPAVGAARLCAVRVAPPPPDAPTPYPEAEKLPPGCRSKRA